jgi:hypothetical protein
MIWLTRPLACGLALFSLCATALAETPALSAAELAAAVRNDEVSIPTPGELMAALDKLGKPDWTARIRPPISTNFSRRAQMALNLGGLIADGYIAVEAEDAQQVKNLGRDILEIAKALGVPKEIRDRGKSLTEKGEEKQWDVLREELEATQNEVKQSLAANQDQPLIDLVTVGGWVRGTEVVSAAITEKYSEAGARLLRQPAIAESLAGRLKALPEKLRDDPVVKIVAEKLDQIARHVAFPREGAPSAESVKQLHELASELIKTISTKEKK